MHSDLTVQAPHLLETRISLDLIVLQTHPQASCQRALLERIMPSLTIVPVAARSIRALGQMEDARAQQAISRFAREQVLVTQTGIKLFTNNCRTIRVGQDQVN